MMPSMRAHAAAEGERVGEEILEPLRRTLAWLASLRDEAGRIVCPEHGIEHTGKSAGALLLALELWRREGRRGDLDLAVQQARRVAGNLVREGTSPCHTFRPGRHDPFNCSNGIIDGGACSDALAELVLAADEALDPRERETFAVASILHARTYLRYAVVDKGVPAQRAWGLTGLAAALRLAPADPASMRAAAYAAIEELAAVQHADGSYPYHPLAWGAEHAGASDVSAFYQSRVTGFLIFALEALGEDPLAQRWRGPIVRGLEFLLALQGPDGVKCGLLEAKPWYFGADYEVSSHPFDIYALARGAELCRQEAGLQTLAARAASGAWRSFAAWVAHLGADGVPSSHRPGHGRGRSYQCPVFWAAHASWIARAANALERARAGNADAAPPARAAIDLRVQVFPQAQLARLEDGVVVAWVRGARPAAVNVHHGSPYGAGLLRCVRCADGAELIVRCRSGGRQEGEWSGRRGLPSLVRGWRAGGREVRFSLWLARVHARAGRPFSALRVVPRTFRRGVLAFAHPRVSSAFVLAPRLEILADGVRLTSGLAHRDGSFVAGSELVREFRVDGGGLIVAERLLADGGARALQFRLPRAASEADVAAREAHYRLA